MTHGKAGNMNIYMYIPDENGNEPMGTSGRAIKENCKRYTQTLFYKYAKKNNKRIVVQSYTEFYDPRTFRTLEG